jgi:hypothetical protein
VLPAEIAGLSPADVICHGEVVRTVELEHPVVGPALAARILRYQFPPGSQQRAIGEVARLPWRRKCKPNKEGSGSVRVTDVRPKFFTTS